ncbi:MAG: DUF3160 domain-containing protein [Patescibacteria group bacterium]|jgi:preprotein translocase subunit SecG|nr:DUF3160 domain-containing protein [Patescibacteria group bacterium]
MPADLPGALSSENPTISDTSSSGGGGFFNKKTILILLGLIVVIILVIFFVWNFVIKNNTNNDTENKADQKEESQEEEEETYFPKLENFENGEEENYIDIGTSTDSGVEKLAFIDYYQESNNNIQPGFSNYNLPINVKVDVLNYYDVSRKLSLDSVIEDLNSNGFAKIDNPWGAYDKDFYSIYDSLKEYQVPILITSDFLIYYQQNSIKTAFKDVEKNIFFDDLFEVSYSMFEAAKKRYEARLSEVGNVNDTILEAARLETVYFAVALELLKPINSQIVKTNINLSSDKFSKAEANKFTVKIPENIRPEVEEEVELIREGNKIEKSPTFLYEIDYNDFTVPSDYKNNDKLNNFYLTNKWLNSVFPLYYKNDNCVDCGLDKEDWQINLIAASMIADDFYSTPSLKNRWARIYKLISFFKGLKDSLNYIYYHQALNSVFGDDYNINELFVRSNTDFDKNLEKYVDEIARYEFLESQGALDRNISENKKNIGFRLLSEPFSPDNYLFKKLTYPETGVYQEEEVADNNITSCRIDRNIERCNGIAFDIINLVYPLTGNSYFKENTNYKNYELRSNSLKDNVNLSVGKKINNFYSSLDYIKKYLKEDKDYFPVYGSTDIWKKRVLDTSAAAWANLQTPMDRYEVVEEEKEVGGSGLGGFSRFSENYNIENNLSLVNELIAQTDMITGMFRALSIDSEVRSAIIELEKTSDKLESIKKIIVKQIEGEELLSTDYEEISNFASRKEENLSVNERKLISWNLFNRNDLTVSIDEFSLLILVNQGEEGKYFSVGPTWDYQEE